MFAITIIMASACSTEQTQFEKHAEFFQSQSRVRVDQWTTAGISYIKDSRTNLCFARGWAGHGHGGPIFTNVPCDSIPLSILDTF